MRRNKYTVGNEAYVIPAIFIILVLSCLSLDMLYVCMNICFTIFFMAVTSIVHTPVKKIIAGITSIFVFIIIIFIGSLYEGKNLHYAGFSLTQLFYFIGLWVTVFYISLIRIDQHLASMRDVDAVSYRLRDIFKLLTTAEVTLKDKLN